MEPSRGNNEACFSRREILRLVVMGVVLIGCSQDNPDTVTRATPNSNNQTETTFATMPAPQQPDTILNTGAAANRVADRIDQPEILDCTNKITILSFGDSIGAIAKPEAVTATWPTLLEQFKNQQPDIEGLVINSLGIPGSTVAGADVGSRLIDMVPNTLSLFTADQKKNMLIIIKPSGNTVNNQDGYNTALNGIIQVVDYIKSNGINLITLPMEPVTGDAETLQNNPNINAFVASFNAELKVRGITPPTMPVSPLLDPATGKGDPQYYDGYKVLNEYFYGLADGVHPDVEGQNRLAIAVANLPELQAVLQQYC